MIFLIEYDRPAGKVLRLDPFEDSERSRAEDCRLELELTLKRDGIDHEVVLLQAETEDAVRRTHRRYFETVDQIADRASD
jgi:hypothetical protein